MSTQTPTRRAVSVLARFRRRPVAAPAAAPMVDPLTLCAVLVCTEPWTATVGPNKTRMCTGHASLYR